ncbi:LOW QUALITY PROTEIN: hypothetical protein SETIT_1G013000v2 [Setaria italica]|uniref:Uncharacterized protein n=1 Tax=Setaria italica TaxID=4555 RepID=A0A368PG17_SETIT|nr:LOW QUALITY PROTEIN: hypothetical protein SETIT_1G013000v2 [Setaria italica]
MMASAPNRQRSASYYCLLGFARLELSMVPRVYTAKGQCAVRNGRAAARVATREAPGGMRGQEGWGARVALVIGNRIQPLLVLEARLDELSTAVAQRSGVWV